MSERDGDYLFHPETTSEAKWLKVTPETQRKLVEIYLGNQEECSKYQLADERVMNGETAILWLMDKIKEANP